VLVVMYDFVLFWFCRSVVFLVMIVIVMLLMVMVWFW